MCIDNSVIHNKNKNKAINEGEFSIPFKAIKVEHIHSLLDGIQDDISKTWAKYERYSEVVCGGHQKTIFYVNQQY